MASLGTRTRDVGDDAGEYNDRVKRARLATTTTTTSSSTTSSSSSSSSSSSPADYPHTNGNGANHDAVELDSDSDDEFSVTMPTTTAVEYHENFDEDTEAAASNHPLDTPLRPIDSIPGVIERIVLENFMCHSNLQIDFNKHINFISGVNGSMLCYLLHREHHTDTGTGTSTSMPLGAEHNFDIVLLISCYVYTVWFKVERALSWLGWR
jgi:hypothetical protein